MFKQANAIHAEFCFKTLAEMNLKKKQNPECQVLGHRPRNLV